MGNEGYGQYQNCFIVNFELVLSDLFILTLSIFNDILLQTRLSRRNKFKGCDRMAKLVNCKVCNAQMASSTKACPSCGAKNKKTLYTRIWFWLIVIIVIIAIGASSNSPNNNASVSVSGGTSPSENAEPIKATAEPVKALQVSAKDLLEAYSANEVKADSQYKGKLLTITGQVTSIDVMFGQTSVTVGTGEIFEFGISCYTQDSETDKVANLNKGDAVTVTGICDGKSLSVSMRKCIIE